jgi:spore maturation protein CgeB
MRVLVAGTMSHIPGHLSTGSAEGFRGLGCEVMLHDYLRFRDNPFWKLANRARLRLRPLARALYPARQRSLLRAVRDFQPGLLLVIGGEPYTVATITQCRDLGARTVLWAADDPYQRGRELVAAPAYDRVYVFDPFYIPALKEHGVRRVDYLPMACDPEVYRPMSLNPGEIDRFGGEVCFVGTWYRNRDVLLRGIQDLPLQIWGGGWPLALVRPDHPLKTHYRGQAMGREVARIYCSNRIVLNILHPQSREGQNMRTFEASATGSLTVTEHSAQLPHLFRPGEEIVGYRDVEDLRRQIRHYLDHPDEARSIAAAGLLRARAEHTYRHRMQRILAEAA